MNRRNELVEFSNFIRHTNAGGFSRFSRITGTMPPLKRTIRTYSTGKVHAKTVQSAPGVISKPILADIDNVA
jgi:hypothetical protein